jgi:membrane protease YdiL (CAAX protease family)
MMGRSDNSTNKTNNANGPYPDLRGAFMLTVLAIVAAGFTGVAFIDLGLLAAVGIGQAIGVGAVATMGAKRVAEPQAERLGLRALDLKMVPMILCLAPAVLLASEVDNFAADWSNPSEQIVDLSDGTEGDEGEAEPEGGDAESELTARLFDPDDPWSLLAAFVVMVGISPVVEEFLFRGVIQQGLVQRMGLLRGVTMVALLWTLLRPAPIAGFSRFVAAAIASFALGWGLGIVRIASASILGPILLASSWAAIGLSAIGLEGKMDLPGMNLEGTHLPWSVTLGSLGLVAWAGWTIYQEAERRFNADHAGSSGPLAPSGAPPGTPLGTPPTPKPPPTTWPPE